MKEFKSLNEDLDWALKIIKLSFEESNVDSKTGKEVRYLLIGNNFKPEFTMDKLVERGDINMDSGEDDFIISLNYKKDDPQEDE